MSLVGSNGCLELRAKLSRTPTTPNMKEREMSTTVYDLDLLLRQLLITRPGAVFLLEMTISFLVVITDKSRKSVQRSFIISCYRSPTHGRR